MSDVGNPRFKRRRPRRASEFAALVLAGAVMAGCAGIASPTSSPSGTTPAPGAIFGTDAGRADWWVAPADLPLSPDARVIHGFLQERSCASGSTPIGRIVGPVIEYGPDAIVVAFKIREIGGTCQSNPRFPITFELAEAVGTRGLFDGGVTPIRDATIDPTIVIAPDEDCGPLVGTDDTKIACITLINATLGDRYQEFAEVRVAAANDDCAGDACTELAAIEARLWTVDATTLDGQRRTWTCAYREAVATCSP